MVERFEGDRRRPRAVQRLLRAHRPRRAAGPLRGPGPPEGGRRRRGHGRRRGLPPGPRVRPAAHRRPRHRHRPPGDAAHRHRRRSATSSSSPRCAPSRSEPWRSRGRGAGRPGPARCSSPSTPGAGTRSGPIKWLVVLTLVLAGAALVLRDALAAGAPAARAGAGRLPRLAGLAAAFGRRPALRVDRHARSATSACSRGRSARCLLVVGTALDRSDDGAPSSTGSLVAGVGVGAVATAEALGWEPRCSTWPTASPARSAPPPTSARPTALLLPVALGVAATGAGGRAASVGCRGDRGAAAAWPASGPGRARPGWGWRSPGSSVAGGVGDAAARAVLEPRRVARPPARRRSLVVAVGRAGAHAGREPRSPTPPTPTAPAVAGGSTSGGWPRASWRDHPRRRRRSRGLPHRVRRGRSTPATSAPTAAASSPTAPTPGRSTSRWPAACPLRGRVAGVVALVGRSALGARSARAPPGSGGSAAGLVAHEAGQLLLFPIVELEPVAWLLAGVVLAGARPRASGSRSRSAVAARRIGELVSAGLGVLAVVGLGAGVTDVAADHRAERAVDALARGDHRAAGTPPTRPPGCGPTSSGSTCWPPRPRSPTSRASSAGIRHVDDALERVARTTRSPCCTRATLLVDRAESTRTAAHLAAATAEVRRLLGRRPVRRRPVAAGGPHRGADRRRRARAGGRCATPRRSPRRRNVDRSREPIGPPGVEPVMQATPPAVASPSWSAPGRSVARTPGSAELVLVTEDERGRHGRPASTSSTRPPGPNIARALSLVARRRRPGRRGHRRGAGPGLRAVAARQPPRPPRGLGLPGRHELGAVGAAPPARAATTASTTRPTPAWPSPTPTSTPPSASST